MYGIRAMVELARYYGKGPLQLKLIAKGQNISIKYLEQLMAILKAAGLVKSVRGSKGGYILAKEPNEIRLSDCFNCLEGPVVTAQCVDDANYCARQVDCVVRDVWVNLHQAIMDVLDSQTLFDLSEKSKSAKVIDYSI